MVGREDLGWNRKSWNVGRQQWRKCGPCLFLRSPPFPKILSSTSSFVLLVFRKILGALAIGKTWDLTLRPLCPWGLTHLCFSGRLHLLNPSHSLTLCRLLGSPSHSAVSKQTQHFINPTGPAASCRGPVFGKAWASTSLLMSPPLIRWSSFCVGTLMSPCQPLAWRPAFSEVLCLLLSSCSSFALTSSPRTCILCLQPLERQPDDDRRSP